MTLVKTRGFDTQLPASSESQSQQEQKNPTVSLEGDSIHFNTDTVTLESFALSSLRSICTTRTMKQTDYQTEVAS